jgi:hypothetical protein
VRRTRARVCEWTGAARPPCYTRLCHQPLTLQAGRLNEGGKSVPGLTPPCHCSRQERRFREVESWRRQSLQHEGKAPDTRATPCSATARAGRAQQTAREISPVSPFTETSPARVARRRDPCSARQRTHTFSRCGCVAGCPWVAPNAARRRTRRGKWRYPELPSAPPAPNPGARPAWSTSPSRL